MWPNTRLNSLFGIDNPILQSPMAGFSGVDMAVAVSEAGGLGSLACATQDAAKLRGMLEAAQSRTQKPFGVNFFAHGNPATDAETDSKWLGCLSPYYRELGEEPPADLSVIQVAPFDSARCAVIEQLRPAIVSFHFGLPDAGLVRRIKAAGILIMSTATTVDEARWLAYRGCDAVIAQGYEAGGHRGMFLSHEIHTQVGTMALVPQIVDAVDLPVVAAGGIADGRGIAAAFALGASGVQMGTAYLHTKEATLSPVYRAALTSAQAHGTSLTNVISGRPTRCLVNRIIREMGPLSNKAPAFPKGFAALAPLRARAEKAGRPDFSALYCGQTAALGQATTSAQLTRDLATDTLRRMSQMARSVPEDGPR